MAPIPFLNDEPYDTRSVWLLTISLIYAGLVNVVLHRRIRTGERPALHTAASPTTLLFVFLLMLHAASRRWILLPMSGSYLVLLLYARAPRSMNFSARRSGRFRSASATSAGYPLRAGGTIYLPADRIGQVTADWASDPMSITHETTHLLGSGMMLVGRYWEESTTYRDAAAFEEESE